jgi:fused signal recognition particle receptor
MHLGIGLLLADVAPAPGISAGGIAALVAMFILVGLVAWRVLRTQRTQQQQRIDNLDGPTRRDPSLDQATQAVGKKGRSAEQEYLRAGLKKTRQEGFVARLTKLFGEQQLDETLVEQIEEVLFRADLGVKTTQSLIAELKVEAAKKELSDPAAVWRRLRQKSEELLVSVGSRPLVTQCDGGPAVWMVVGVNGSGKTTTIGKLAHRLAGEGKKVLVAAGDTYRAAAVDQLEVWCQRAGVPIHRGKDNADPASVAFAAVERGKAEGFDIVIVDTAGRLHTNHNLMEELKKSWRVCGKAQGGAPHEVLLVLDATMGQNAVKQAEQFREAVAVSGIVLTKLDGTAKGGVVLAIAEQLRLPVKLVGVGERMEDLRDFDPHLFAEELFDTAAD